MQLIYGVRGISVFAIVRASLAEMAQQPPLVRFAELSIIEVSKLRSGGFGIEPTGRNPRHYTLVLGDLAEAVDRLCAVEHDVWPNPYHEADA